LGVVVVEGSRELVDGVASVLQEPSAGAGQGVAGMDEVPVPGEAAQHVPDALLQRVQLRADQHLHHALLRGELDQALSCRKKKVIE